MKRNSILIMSLSQATKAGQWLNRSYEQCKNIDFSKADVSAENLDSLEALTSRFSRLADILVNKVFRTIEIAELEIPGTLIDTINRIAKRGIVQVPDEVREIKDLRNTISHEYADNELLKLMREVLQRTPELLAILKSTEAYCRSKNLV